MKIRVRPRIFSEQPASTGFLSFLQQHFEGHTPDLHIVDCIFCNRIALSENWKRDLLPENHDAMEAKTQENPERYFFTRQPDPVALGIWNDEFVVLECPCHRLAQIEDSLLRNRYLIELYFKELDKEEKQTVLQRILWRFFSRHLG